MSFLKNWSKRLGTFSLDGKFIWTHFWYLYPLNITGNMKIFFEHLINCLDTSREVWRVYGVYWYNRSCPQCHIVRPFFDKNFPETEIQLLSENQKTEKYEIFRFLNFCSNFQKKQIKGYLRKFLIKLIFFRAFRAFLRHK